MSIKTRSGRLVLMRAERLLGVGSDLNLKAVSRQHKARQLDVDRVVIDDQDAQWVHGVLRMLSAAGSVPLSLPGALPGKGAATGRQRRKASNNSVSAPPSLLMMA